MHSYKKVKEILFFLSQNWIGMQLKQTKMKKSVKLVNLIKLGTVK